MLVLAGLGAGAPAGRADEADVRAEVRRLLAADTPSALAWAAHTAAAHGVVAAGDDLVLALLRVLEGLGGPEQGPWVRAALVDALTRLKVPLPDDLLLALGPGGRDDLAVHLLEVQPEATARLQRVYGAWDGTDGPPGVADEGGAAWLALGNHLARRRPPGFAARVLRRASITRRVEVWPSAPSDASSAPAPPRGEVPGCGVARAPAGFPPVAVRRLWTQPGAGRRLLSAGPLPVWASREVLAPGDGLGFATSLRPRLSRARARWAWIGGWLPPALAERLLPLEDERTLAWTGRQPFERALRPIVEAVHRQHAQVLLALVEAGLLTPLEARALEPDLHVELVDARVGRRAPLPPVPAPRTRHPFAPRPPLASGV